MSPSISQIASEQHRLGQCRYLYVVNDNVDAKSLSISLAAWGVPAGVPVLVNEISSRYVNQACPHKRCKLHGFSWSTQRDMDRLRGLIERKRLVLLLNTPPRAAMMLRRTRIVPAPTALFLMQVAKTTTVSSSKKVTYSQPGFSVSMLTIPKAKPKTVARSAAADAQVLAGSNQGRNYGG